MYYYVYEMKNEEKNFRSIRSNLTEQIKFEDDFPRKMFF